MNCLHELWAIMLPRHRRAAAGLFVLMLVGTLLEALNIGLILPVLALLTGDSSAMPEGLRPWASSFGMLASGRGVILMLLALVAVYALKSAFLLGVAFWCARFGQMVQADTCTRLFAAFLSLPWHHGIRIKSTSIQQSIIDAQSLALTCLQTTQVISEVLVLAGLLSLLLFVEPLGTLVVAGLLGVAFWGFNHVARPLTRRLAARRKAQAQVLLELTQQAVGGGRAIKVSGTEREFINRFTTSAARIAAMATRRALVEHLPRQLFELVAIIALMLLAVVLTAEGRPAGSLLPMLGLFATVAFRVLPSVSSTAIAFQRLHANEPALAALRHHLELEHSRPTPAPTYPRPFRDKIRMEGIVYRYAGAMSTALRGIDIEIPRGAKVGLIGGSGAGKSTLVDVLLGLLPPTHGRVTVDGSDIHDDVRGWQWTIGYVPQTIYLADDTIRRNVAFGVPERRIDDDAVHRALKAARLDEFVAGLPAGVDTPAGEWGTRLSGGQRQRIGIARALYADPHLLVLDEATSALDSQTEREVMEAVDSLHGVKTLVIVAHRLSTVANCDLIYRLEDGRIAQCGTFAEVVPAGA
jgi:ABC-type multidrug transport system fused ATPase/permease subunit